MYLINQLTNQSSNQSVNKTNQSTNKTNNQSINQLISQSIHRCKFKALLITYRGQILCKHMQKKTTFKVKMTFKIMHIQRGTLY